MADDTAVTDGGTRTSDTVDPQTVPLGSNPLNSPDVVEELVREFMTNVVAVRIAYLNGTINPDDCAGQIDALSGRMQSIFYGQDAEYSPLTSWNVPGALGQFICNRMDFPQAEQPDAVRLLFHNLASDLLEVLAATETGKADEDRANSESDGLIDGYRDILMGIQPGEEA